MCQISQERTAEVEAHQRLLTGITDTSTVAIAVVEGPELRYRRVNPAYQSIIGLDVPLLGHTYREVFPEAAARGAEAQMRRVLQTGHSWSIRDFATPLPGRAELTWWEGEVRPLPGVAAPKALLMVTWDITPRKQTEEALRQSEERFRVALARKLGLSRQ